MMWRLRVASKSENVLKPICLIEGSISVTRLGSSTFTVKLA